MKSKSTTKPWKQAQPFLMGAANNLQSVYNTNAPGLAQMSQSLQNRSQQLMDRGMTDSPSLAAGRGYATDVLGGKYLNGNQHLESMIGRARSNVMDDANARASLRGRTGGDRHGYDLGRGLADAELGLRYGNYSDEMGRMERAAGMVPSFDAAQNANISLGLGATELGANLPYIGANNLTRGMSTLFSPYSTTTQRPSFGQLALQGLGNAASAFAGGGF